VVAAQAALGSSVSIRGKKIFCCMDTAKTAQIPGQTDFPGVTGEFISAVLSHDIVPF
jgi:hypothetical protein